MPSDNVCDCKIQNSPFAQIYHLASKVPSWVRAIAPKGSLEIHEEAWNAYPYCKTVLSNPGYMKDGFYIMVETYHIADKGDSDNVHELPKVRKLSLGVVVSSSYIVFFLFNRTSCRSGRLSLSTLPTIR